MVLREYVIISHVEEPIEYLAKELTKPNTKFENLP